MRTDQAVACVSFHSSFGRTLEKSWETFGVCCFDHDGYPKEPSDFVFGLGCHDDPVVGLGSATRSFRFTCTLLPYTHGLVRIGLLSEVGLGCRGRRKDWGTVYMQVCLADSVLYAEHYVGIQWVENME